MMRKHTINLCWTFELNVLEISWNILLILSCYILYVMFLKWKAIPNGFCVWNLQFHRRSLQTKPVSPVSPSQLEELAKGGVPAVTCLYQWIRWGKSTAHQLVCKNLNVQVNQLHNCEEYVAYPRKCGNCYWTTVPSLLILSAALKMVNTGSMGSGSSIPC